MALTPEDVVNKRFQPTKFREGYDQDEVDDFLDEIVVELRRLYKENDDLRAQLAEAKAQLAKVEGGGANVPAPVAASGKSDAPAEAKKEEAPKAAATAPAPAVSTPAPTPAASSGTNPSAESAANVLAMAQQLHDDYVNAGVQQRDKIIAEAQIEASSLVRDAQDKSRKTLGALEQQKGELERKVEELRGFERDYRSRLKAYIEGQLRDLDERKSVASDTSSSSS